VSIRRRRRGTRVRSRGTPGGAGATHVAARVDFTMHGPCGVGLPASLWRDEGRLRLSLDLEETPAPDSALVQTLHAGLVARSMTLDLVHGRQVLVLGDPGRPVPA